MLDFLGIGAQKAGTTWLFERLQKHPEIHFPHIKEISFWNAHYPRSLKDADYKKNINWYRSLFNHWEEDASPEMARVVEAALTELPALPEYKRGWFDQVMAGLDRTSGQAVALHSLEVVREEKIEVVPKLGEISPTYCYFEDPAVLPKIREFAPDVRIIYIVRHPFDRAWSSAQMAIKRSEMTPDEASDQWYIDQMRSYLSQKYGNYPRALADWHAAFPKEQILLMRFEDIPVDPQGFLRRACEHIGVEDTTFFDKVAPEKLAQKVFSGTGAELRPSLLPVLHELYDAQIDALKADFGIDYTRYPLVASDTVPKKQQVKVDNAENKRRNKKK